MSAFVECPGSYQSPSRICKDWDGQCPVCSQWLTTVEGRGLVVLIPQHRYTASLVGIVDALNHAAEELKRAHRFYDEITDHPSVSGRGSSDG